MTVTVASPAPSPRQADHSPAPSTVIIDCGSGYSRVASYQISSETNSIHCITTPIHLDALHTVIHCTNQSTKWLSQLIDVVREVDSQATEVLIGATGGVRDLISSGGVTHKEVDAFRELVASADLPFDATFLVLGGNDEARYEFVSAEYCVRQCGFVDASSQEEPGTKESEKQAQLGLLSSGGMSSQIYAGSVSHCLETEIKRGNRLGLEHGMVKGKEAYHRHVTNVVESNVPTNFGGENTLYVAIEMLAAAGEKAGMGGIVVPVAEAIDILSTFIRHKTEEDMMNGDEFERTWRTYVSVMSAIVGKAILGRLHSKSKVLFLRQFELGRDHVLKPSWPLGRAIEHLANA